MQNDLHLFMQYRFMKPSTEKVYHAAKTSVFLLLLNEIWNFQSQISKVRNEKKILEKVAGKTDRSNERPII